MADEKKKIKVKVKQIKKIARQEMPLKNLQTKKIPSKKKRLLDEISEEEIIDGG